jgi:hypothetical protein
VMFSHHLEEPFPLEDIKKKTIHAKLWFTDSMFLLANDQKIMELLNEKHDTETLDNISKRLLGILKTSITNILPANTRNYEVFDGKSKLEGTFHRDGSDLDSVLLKVWIALNDVVDRPLAFLNSADPENNFPQTKRVGDLPSYDSRDEYVISPNMKRGEMLIFFSTQRAHGSPVFEGVNHNDAPHSAVFSYLCKLGS